jgi:hypothetical protein
MKDGWMVMPYSRKPEVPRFTTTMKTDRSLYQQYKSALLRKFPHLRPSVLVGSFLFLHEVTAVVPLVGFYYLFSLTGLGLSLTSSLKTSQDKHEEREEGLVRSQLYSWLDAAQQKTERVGRRYGWWGYEKWSSKSGPLPEDLALREIENTDKFKGQIANVVMAYTLVKVQFM